MLESITPLILTFNEEANLARTLAKLDWASEIILVDSFSDDATCEIARQRRGLKLFQREFDSHAEQWNYGLKQARKFTLIPTSSAPIPSN